MMLSKVRGIWKPLAVLGLWLQHCQCQSDAPSVDNFRWRTLHSVATLGNFLYIDGGQLSQYITGTNETTTTLTNNSTLSIALDQPWTPSTASIIIIQKSAPIVKRPALWPDTKKNVMYSWGGEGFGSAPSPTYFWQFNPDGNGKGSWTKNGSPGDGIRAGTDGSAVICAGRGFLLGGIGTGWTDPSYGSAGGQLQPGMLIYDFGLRSWNNATPPPPAPYSQHRQGQGTCLPFGDEGVVTFFGGTQSLDDTAQDYVPFDNMTFYDPKTEKWFSQTTRGDIPETRRRFCAVGAAGPDGTYEIFVYGGRTPAGTVLSDVYVLSIPAFQWFRASTDSRYIRLDHRCAVAGNRHMISVGGNMQKDGAGKNDWHQAAQDPRPQGIGVFDMSTLIWTDKYNPAAQAYEPATVIKDWYSSNDLTSVPWNNDQVKNYFFNGTSTGTAPQATKHASSSTPVGAIAGGVVGGVAALAAFIGGAWLWYRRRVKRPRLSELGTQSSGYEQAQKPESELGPDASRPEMPAPAESPNSKFLSVSPPVELPASNSYYELPQSEEDRSRYRQ